MRKFKKIPSQSGRRDVPVRVGSGPEASGAPRKGTGYADASSGLAIYGILNFGDLLVPDHGKPRLPVSDRAVNKANMSAALESMVATDRPAPALSGVCSNLRSPGRGGCAGKVMRHHGRAKDADVT